jgi:hypothetical protein
VSNAVLASLVLSLFTVVFPTLPFRLLCAISIDNDSRISVHGVANACGENFDNASVSKGE